MLSANTATCGAVCFCIVSVSFANLAVHDLPQPLSTKLLCCLSFMTAMLYGLHIMGDNKSKGECGVSIKNIQNAIEIDRKI